jgi:membrane protein DedA with SNARE-associated domain
MPFEKLVLSFIAVNLPLLCVVGAFVGGDVLIIFLSSLAGQGLINFWTIILFCSIGTVSSDVMWFFLARTRFADRLISSRQLNSGYAKLDRLLSKYGRNDFLLLLLVKFIYGIRIIAIVYFSRERRYFARFLNYNTFAVVVITLFVAFLGWMAGRGIRTYVDYYENFKTVMKIIVIFFVAFVILKSLLKKWLLKENKGA